MKKLLKTAMAFALSVMFLGINSLNAKQVDIEGTIVDGTLPNLTIQTKQGNFVLDLNAQPIMGDTKKYNRELARKTKVRVEGVLTGNTIVVYKIYTGKRMNEQVTLQRQQQDNRDDRQHGKKDFGQFKNYGQYMKWLNEQKKQEKQNQKNNKNDKKQKNNKNDKNNKYDKYDDDDDDYDKYDFNKYNTFDDREKYDNYGRRLDYDKYQDMREFYKNKFEKTQLTKITAQIVRINWPTATVRTARGNINVDIGPADNFTRLGVNAQDLVGKNALFVYSAMEKKTPIIRAVRFRNYTVGIARNGKLSDDLDELDAIDIIDFDQQNDTKSIIDFLGKPKR